MLASILKLNSLIQPVVIEDGIERVKIQLNDSPFSHLLLFPRVGVKAAHKIMTYRKSSQIETAHDLLNVKGVGAATIDAMLPFIEGKSK